MGRKIKISASALNVRLHPHSSDIYQQWIKEIHSRRVISQVHGDRYGIISSLDRSQSTSDIITGAITTFVKFDEIGNWFNAAEMTEATDEDVSKIIIPKDLFPNSASFYFYFDCKKHHIYFQTYSAGKTLTPQSALRLFSGFGNSLDISKTFKEPKISILQDKTSIDAMFSISKIKEIRITILKPNSDIFDEGFESKIESHLAKVGSREISVSYKADSGGSIRPDAEIRRISDIATENGEVEVIGRDDKGAVRLTSENFPREIHDKYDPEEQGELSAFLQMMTRREDVEK